MYTDDMEPAIPDWTISELMAAYREGTADITSVAAAYVQRIADEDPITVNAVITLNPFWHEQAARLQRHPDPGSLPLYGIPLLVKDNIDTLDMGNSAGSIALKDVLVPNDAPLVTRLLDAGALILGKTNLSEWANFRSTGSVSGWSSLGGQTRNAANLKHSPSGSSSGSAAAVAMNFCVAAIGTETDGSIISPSAHNGVVGLKPTLGRVSRHGIIPIAPSQDTAGPIAKSAEDCARILDVLTGIDSHDAATLDQPLPTSSFASLCSEGLLTGKRLGYLPPNEQFPETMAETFQIALDHLRQMGVELVELEPVPSLVTLQSHEIEILCHEFPGALADYIKNCRPDSPYQDLAAFAEFNREHARATMPLFKQEWFDRCLNIDVLKSAVYEAAQQHMQEFRTQMQQHWFEEQQLDALVCPANGPAWLIEAERSDRYSGGYSELAAVSGWPSITVPYAQQDGLPLGAMFVTLPWQETELIGIAHAFEQQVKLKKT